MQLFGRTAYKHQSPARESSTLIFFGVARRRAGKSTRHVSDSVLDDTHFLPIFLAVCYDLIISRILPKCTWRSHWCLYGSGDQPRWWLCSGGYFESRFSYPGQHFCYGGVKTLRSRTGWSDCCARLLECMIPLYVAGVLYFNTWIAR